MSTMDKALTFLREFDTAEDFRLYCQAQGIRAQQMCPSACLLAEALVRVLGVPAGDVRVSGATFRLFLPEAEWWQTGVGPAWMTRAVDHFDAGDYPELIA